MSMFSSICAQSTLDDAWYVMERPAVTFSVKPSSVPFNERPLPRELECWHENLLPRFDVISEWNSNDGDGDDSADNEAEEHNGENELDESSSNFLAQNARPTALDIAKLWIPGRFVDVHDGLDFSEVQTLKMQIGEKIIQRIRVQADGLNDHGRGIGEFLAGASGKINAARLKYANSRLDDLFKLCPKCFQIFAVDTHCCVNVIF